MSDLICDRAFVHPTDDGEHRFVVEWMKPCRDKGSWRCDWIIHWFVREPRHGSTFGEDSTQALILAMEMVEALISHEASTAYWLEEGGGLGLPVMKQGAQDA